MTLAHPTRPGTAPDPHRTLTIDNIVIYGEATVCLRRGRVWARGEPGRSCWQQPTPAARGQNAPLLVFFMVLARWQSQVPSARPKKGSPDGPTLTPTLRKNPVLLSLI